MTFMRLRSVMLRYVRVNASINVFDAYASHHAPAPAPAPATGTPYPALIPLPVPRPGLGIGGDLGVWADVRGRGRCKGLVPLPCLAPVPDVWVGRPGEQ